MSGAVSEFDLIDAFFKSGGASRDDVILGIGDDCALLSPPPGKLLAFSTDTLISGVHFPVETSPEDIGYKSLAVNLSDLAAMGAEPAWVSLAISLPEPDERWLRRFMQGFSELAHSSGVALVGGDTTRGDLSITISVTGFVDTETNFTRHNARPGDVICVTGTLGDAAAGLKLILEKDTVASEYAELRQQLNRPQPQLKAAELLQPFRVAAIDLSDGLLSDLSHICEASQCGAQIRLEDLPASKSLCDYLSTDSTWPYQVNAGDDYQLCFTCDKNDYDHIKAIMSHHSIPLTAIGVIRTEPGISCSYQGTVQPVNTSSGYNHFINEK